MTDLNDGLWGYECAAVGPIRPDSDGPVAERFARMMEDQHLVAYNTFHDCGHTFFGSSSSSLIDFIAGPRGWLPRVQHMRAQHRRSRLLQLIPSPGARDHIALSLEVDVRLTFGQSVRPRRWDHERIWRCLRDGKGRAAFVGDPESRASTVDWVSLVTASPLPDACWDALSSILLEVGAAHFEGRGGEEERLSQMRQERRRLHGARREACSLLQGQLGDAFDLFRAELARTELDIRRSARSQGRRHREFLEHALAEAWRR